ncbi:hypothetical protein H4R18_000571 [Coemansia javaensis]|uniref:Uncharacterized protein n=1 Tax=Coemansia javaensis TaxID=2761396 RepID=A0A9W8LLX9_9FUNG|nr:hypothetical protein H4R18_000571 [Coemansia javaensis]
MASCRVKVSHQCNEEKCHSWVAIVPAFAFSTIGSILCSAPVRAASKGMVCARFPYVGQRAVRLSDTVGKSGAFKNEIQVCMV